MKKRFMSICMVLCMLLSMLPAASAADVRQEYEVSTFVELQEKLGETVPANTNVVLNYVGLNGMPLDLEITKNITIPEDVEVRVENGNLTIESGVTVTNKGEIYVCGEALIESGAVLENDQAFYVEYGLNVSGTINNADGAGVSFYGNYFTMGSKGVINNSGWIDVDGWLYSDVMAVSSKIIHSGDDEYYGDGGTITFWHYTDSEYIEDDLDYILALPEMAHVYHTVCVQEDWAMTKNRTLPSHVNLDLWCWVDEEDPDPIVMTIPAGVTLTTYGECYIGANMKVNGTWKNEGYATIQLQENVPGVVTLKSSDCYQGEGILTVDSIQGDGFNYQDALKGFDFSKFDLATGSYTHDNGTVSVWWELIPGTGEGFDQGTVPTAPVTSKITNVVSGVRVSWKAVADADKYVVYYSGYENGTYNKLGTTTNTNYLHSLTAAKSGKTYYYKIAAVNQAGESELSEAIGITYVATPDITSRSNVAAGVKLGWNKITGATGYAIYRKSYDGTDAWSRVATISGNSTFTWTDTSVKNNNGEIYKYTIRALTGSKMNILSGCRNAGRTMVRLSSQVLKSAAAASATSIKCSWTTSSRVTGYEVRFMVDGEVYKTVTIGAYKTGVKTFTGLKAGQTYDVQVRTYKKVDGVGSFYSDWSTAKTVEL